MSFKFYDGLDFVGNDLNRISKKSVEELKELCISDPKCSGFNTLGFMKHSVDITPSCTNNGTFDK